jgi:hypothetical protein
MGLSGAINFKFTAPYDEAPPARKVEAVGTARQKAAELKAG